MMAKSSNDRYQSAEEVVEAMTEYIGDGEERGFPANRQPRAAHRSHAQ